MINSEARTAAYYDEWRNGLSPYSGSKYLPDRIKGMPAPTWLGFGGRGWAETYHVNKIIFTAVETLYAKYTDLVRVNDVAAVPQIESGLVEVYRLAKQTVGQDYESLVVDDLLVLVARLAALADVANERQLILAGTDQASLARTAEVIATDLARARAAMAQTDLEWKIAQASPKNILANKDG